MRRVKLTFASDSKSRLMTEVNDSLQQTWEYSSEIFI